MKGGEAKMGLCWELELARFSDRFLEIDPHVFSLFKAELLPGAVSHSSALFMSIRYMYLLEYLDMLQRSLKGGCFMFCRDLGKRVIAQDEFSLVTTRCASMVLV
jgi:hypothetical protein